MSREVLADIDETIKDLVKTSELIKSAKSDHLFDHEIEALEKTQESLLARLMNRQSLLDLEKRKKMLDSIRKEDIEKKVVDFARSLKPLPQKSARSRRARSKS